MNHMILLIQSNFTFLEPIMLLLIVFLLFLGFRKAGGVFLPLTIVFLSITWALGLMGWFGMSVDMLSGIMPVILIAMASADGIHIMRRYYEKRQSGIMGTAAIKETFFELSKPIIITTVTTIIGFLSLVSSNFSVIRQFGLVTSLGVFLALVVTVLLIPAVLAFSKSTKNIKRESGKKAGEFKFMEHWAGFVFSKKIFIFLLMGLIVIAAVIGIPKIKKSVDWTLCLRRGSKAHQAEILLRREFGGTVPVQIIVKGDLKDAHTMKAMRYLERYLEAVPSVGEIHSIATIISEMNDTMNDRYLVPESNEGVANLWFLIEDEDVVEQLVREDKKEALIQAKIDSWETDFISGAVNQIDKFIEKLSKRLIVVELKDVLPEAKKALLRFRQERITANLFRTFSKRDMIIEKEKIETIVNDALFRENLREEGYAEVKQEVIDYLLSERSEVGNISKESAEAIAENLLKGVRKDGEIGTDVILRVVTSILSNQPNFLNRKESNLDDLNELSKSLDVIIRENIAELRVESALEEIKKLVRPGSIRRRELLRDLKGDLWEINESFIALDKQRHQELLIDLDIPKIREVPLSFEHTGLAAVLNKMEEELIPTQILSLFIAFAAVVIILALIFRSLLLGLLGVIPITMTLLVNFSIMGYFDIGLDSFTAMIASIAIGLGIDTDVHFISCLRREFSKHKDEFLALKETMKTTGVAIIINAIAVGVGFAVLLLAGGQHIRRFGGLASLTILLSAFFTLTVLPAIILLVKPKFMRKGGNK